MGCRGSISLPDFAITLTVFFSCLEHVKQSWGQRNHLSFLFRHMLVVRPKVFDLDFVASFLFRNLVESSTNLAINGNLEESLGKILKSLALTKPSNNRWTFL